MATLLRSTSIIPPPQDPNGTELREITFQGPPVQTTQDPFANLLVVVYPDHSLAVATTKENEHLIIGKGETGEAEDNNTDEEPSFPQSLLHGASPSAMYMRLARYYSNPMRTRRRKFLISLLLSDILYCLLLLSATRDFSLFTVLLICIVLVDLLGIVGASRDSLAILTTFIILSSASVIAQSIMAFSPLFILRILVVLMAFRVRGELMLQSQLFPSSAANL
eukprot:Phypoly_transcript_17035.p1 GENE.Phypoly_transcript_17035~~Phypoly_transcript_17035.p1  ORF type:complete len:233 (+),score=22.90 Phypoly_transcript_17035:34-699(+)